MDPIYACVSARTCAHTLLQNYDRITTHSELCSGSSGPRQRMREQCNISIRQDQALLAENEFVRLLDRPCCSDSALAEPDSTAAVLEK